MKRTIGEIAEIVMGQSPKSEFYNNNGDGMPFLQGNRTFGDLYPTFDTYTTNPTKTAKAGDIIMSVRAPVGDLNITPVDMCLGRGVCALRMKNGNQSYLFYLLKHNVKTLINRESGTVFGSVNYKDIASLVVDYEENEEEQRRIGQFLWDVDQKIETNKAINNNLQHQAKALFQDWFVDFAPFGGVMPSDWKNGKLKDVLRLKRNAIKAGEDPSLPYLPIDIIPMNTFAVTDFRPNSEAQSSLITFDRDDIVIGAMRVYFHRVICAPCRGITRTTCFTLAPFDTAYLSFALLCCDQKSSIDYAQTTSKGSTMPYAVWEGGLGDMDILIPTREIALKFNELVLPMLRILQSSYFENHHLRTVRDILLTKLLSGEIDVSEVEF